VLLDSTKVLVLYGVVKFPTPSLNSLPSNGSSSSSMIMSSPKEKKITTKPLNSASPLLQVTSLVSSALSSHIPQTPSSQNFTARAPKQEESEKKSAESMDKSASKDYGLDSLQESS